MKFDLVRLLLAVVATVALASLGFGLYAFSYFPWHRVNRASRVPVRRRTVAVARYSLSAAFLAVAVTALAGLAVYGAQMARLRTMASGGPADPSVLQRVALALPAEPVVAAGTALTVVLVVVPSAVVVFDVLTAVVGGRRRLDRE